MKTLKIIAGLTLFSLAVSTHAQLGANAMVDAAVKNGDFVAYQADLVKGLNVKVPGGATEPVLIKLTQDPVFANMLCQWQLIQKIGAANVSAFAKADPKNKEFLSWLLNNTKAMDQFLLAAVPTGLKAREENKYTLGVQCLEVWKNIYYADPDSKDGMWLKLATATALNPPPSKANHNERPIDPVARYKHFKAAQQNKELAPSFDKLTVWEYSKVVCASHTDDELAWGRQMVKEFRPDLIAGEKVVDTVSMVWRRNSPWLFGSGVTPASAGVQTILAGGGKCGPRGAFGVFINQAWGIPAIGVGQPKHACVAFKTIAGTWTVGYGRGWIVSKLDGLTGPDFVVGVEARARLTQFSRVEHLRWLASALPSKEQSAVIMGVVGTIAKADAKSMTNMTASEKGDEAEADPGVKLNPEGISTSEPSAAIQNSKETFQMKNGALVVDAGNYAKTEGQALYDGFKGVQKMDSHPPGTGAQIYFRQQQKYCRAEYNIDLPEAGTYELVFKAAVVNEDQQLTVMSGTNVVTTAQVPLTFGLWTLTKPVDVKLEKGPQTFTIAVPENKRGVAVKQFELKAKGTK